MDSPKVLVLRAAGSNCDMETAYAFNAVGAQADMIHVNRVVNNEISLEDYHVLAIPGGFTYGDDVSAGKILANEMRYKIGQALWKFYEDEKLIIGICNGFQVLVKSGLLPDVARKDEQLVTLANNDSGKFEDRWVYLKINNSQCVFTKNMPEIVYYPVAHAEGKFVPDSPGVLDDLKAKRQIVFSYTGADGMDASYPWNPNGSVADIAGICDQSGRVLGLMPHPERHFDPTNHPRWTREGLKNEGDGVSVFRNAVEYVKENF